LKAENRFSEPPFAYGGLGLHPQTPALLLPSAIATLSSSLLVLNAFYCPLKTNKITQ